MKYYYCILIATQYKWNFKKNILNTRFYTNLKMLYKFL